MLGRPDAASPHVPELASRRLIRSAVGREITARLYWSDRAEIAGRVLACGSSRAHGRKGYRVQQHDVSLHQGKREMPIRVRSPARAEQRTSPYENR
jgi:hypothetical protein